MNGLNAIVRTERGGSGLTDSVFLVVDNDADDLATFASALTSRYASEYEIRTAATASEAHATLAALSVAGITVALLIVSRDLGDADLLLLLQRARELFPSARRVLRARYVDPSAFDLITGAMRTGRIDYFLYKPCEPVVTRDLPGCRRSSRRLAPDQAGARLRIDSDHRRAVESALPRTARHPGA